MILREPLSVDTTAFNARRFAESFAGLPKRVISGAWRVQ
jgi:hypothetical protein